MAPHVLVADDDAWILRMVATVLEKRGYSVETAVDGEDALQRALARTPDLLITDVMMPKMDGWSLVRQLRAHAELAMLPVIFLTALSSEDDRIRGFRLGADDYVTKPFRFEELDLRVAKTLRRAQQSQQDTREQLAGSGLRGDLSQVGLSSLLVLIEMERKTGLLQMRAPGGPSGQILVREGKVVHARLDEQDDPVDAECVYYMLTWGAGEFEFIACVVEGVDRVSVSTTHLLMEGARLMDEANEPNLQPAVQIPEKSDAGSSPRVSAAFAAMQDPDEVPAGEQSASQEASAADASAADASAADASAADASAADASAADASVADASSVAHASIEEAASAAGASSAARESSARASLVGSTAPKTPPLPDSPANDAPTVIPSGGLTNDAPPSGALTNDAPPSGALTNDAPTVIPSGAPTRASSPSVMSTRASSPALADSSSTSRTSSPSIADASSTSRASSPSIVDPSSTSRTSSPAIPSTRTSSPAIPSTRASSPAIPPIPSPPTRKSSPSMPAEKPASASGSMAATTDDPADDNWD